MPSDNANKEGTPLPTDERASDTPEPEEPPLTGVLTEEDIREIKENGITLEEVIRQIKAQFAE